jgi:hypothetical protein
MYGLLELVVGVVGAYFVLRSMSGDANGLTDSVLYLRMTLMFASVYVIVRAFDNIGVGLKGTRFEPHWKKLI